MKLSHPSLAFCLLLSAGCLTACDEGPIYDTLHGVETESRSAVFSGVVTGSDRWAEGYDLVLAAFGDDSEYALVQKPVVPAPDGSVKMTLNGIPAEAATVEFCVTDRLRRRIVTFESVNIPTLDSADTLQLALPAPMNVGMFAAIQRCVFDGTAYNCSLCHGSESPRAGLDLTAGHSYAALVGTPSTRVDGAQRVVPGAAPASVLHSALAEGNPAGLRYDHSPLVPTTLRRLIDDWIDAGAEE